MRFRPCKNFENRLRFDKVTETLKVGTFLRHSVDNLLTLLSALMYTVNWKTHQMFYFFYSTRSILIKFGAYTGPNKFAEK